MIPGSTTTIMSSMMIHQLHFIIILAVVL